ncbi:hypothetical protein [Leucobacter chinensis]|uniref:hypothetical protein n=1 Tax=Leucobacter chinensis TaxID=2851010 RepID=UPI001C220397|nr:hypothetical protein [Leucobacter chinensis]
MRRRFASTWVIALGCALAIAAVVVAPAQAVDVKNAALTVTPSHGLFDVTLYPGDSVRAVATLNNNTSVELEVGVTPILADWANNDRGLSALQLSSHRGSDCDASAMAGAPTVNMGAATRLDQGTILPGQAQEFCLEVAYPSEAELEQPAISVVDLSFSAIERGNGGAELPPTGSDEGGVLSLALAGGALVLLGAAALSRRAATPEAAAVSAGVA